MNISTFRLNLLCLGCIFFSVPLWAGNSGSAAVIFNFQEVNEISLSGSPSLDISSVTAGQQPQSVIDSSARYAISTNGLSKQIVASIDQDMPANIMLEMKLVKPGGVGDSFYYVALSTTPAVLITGITPVADGASVVYYRLSATINATPTSDARTVTLTLTD